MEYLGDKDEHKSIVRSKRKSFSLYLFDKRAFDIILSLFALIILSPVFLIVWVLNIINVDDRGPLFYRQIRVGLNGKNLECINFVQ